METFDAKKETQNCIGWISNWFEEKSGNAKGAVIGISGGKDSTVVAGLLCAALGKEKVMGVLMPSGLQKDIQDSKKVCAYLGIDYRVVNIESIYRSAVEAIEDCEGTRIALSTHTKTNIAPRLRMTVLYAIGQELNFRVAGTGNLSERYVGYSTKWGDTANDFNPIANFTTEEVVKIGEQLHMPDDLLKKTPEDGLSGKTDEENLGFSYAILNGYIKTGFCSDPEIKGKIDKLHEYNKHKLLSIPIYTPKI